MASGGNRNKAGRPKGSPNKSTEEKRAIRDRILRRVKKELDPILDGQVDLATGIFMIEETKNGTLRRYREKPDHNAAKTLIEQAAGKPEQSLTGKDGEDLKLGVVYLPAPEDSNE